VALSHGPEPTEQTLRESKENTATKIRSTRAENGEKERRKKHFC